MNADDYTLLLVNETLSDLDSSEVRLSGVVRKCIRIARLRNDYVNLWWLEWEMVNITEEQERLAALRDIVPHFTTEAYEFFRQEFNTVWAKERECPKLTKNMEVRHDGSMLAKGLGEIEIDIDLYDRLATEAQVPQGLYPADAYRVDQAKSQTRYVTSIMGNGYRAIIERVKQRVHGFLSQTEKQVLFGQIYADIFEKNRLFVNLKLGEICPDALAKFVSAYQRVKEDDPESWAQALTSCRRLLKSLADALYPPTDTPVVGPDGKSRVLSDDKYVSRLWQYVYEQTSRSTSGELLMVSINDLGNRIDNIYDLANKGVHSDASSFEANQCVIQTYLLAGDLMRIAEGQSAIGIEKG